ncbi:MAG: methyltransferase domain-containing protein [Oscillospiraceae bacterium]|nr:methyltransferase domain-containing protein [Oscillospiraceae bacterium]
MGKDELDKRLRRLHEAADSFALPDIPDGSFKGVKRLGGKMTYWYTQPFGAAQNDFNRNAVDAMDELKRQIDRLREQLAEAESRSVQRIASAKSDVQQDYRKVIARNYLEQQEAMEKMSAEIDYTLSYAAPQNRVHAGKPPLTQLPVIGTESLFQEFRAVQNAENGSDASQALDCLGEEYKKLLEDSVHVLSSPKNCKPVALVVRSYQSTAGMEAIRNEVWDLYQLLRSASRYPVCIVSVEGTGESIRQSGDLYAVPESMLGDWVRTTDPALLIYCESTTNIMHLANDSLLLRNSIVRLSAQNPIQELGGSLMQELQHLCDFGVQHYCTCSSFAADKMEEAGFRRPDVIYPYMDPQKPLFIRKPRGFDPEKLTIGFASSPMLPHQSDSRGIPVLCEVVAQNPDVHFIVLWRDAEAVAVPEMLRNAENCEVHIGKYDMSQFYDKVDCILVPYADINYNHACSMSALEGMMMGIPVIATPVAGVSELVKACGIGMVTEHADAASVTKAIQQFPMHYSAFQEAWRTEKLHGMVSNHAFVQYVESCIEEAVPVGVHTLYEWDRQLKINQKHLVRGSAALKAYYQRQEIAANYTEDRFLAYPQNCFDLMERKSVAVLLSHYLAGKRNVQLLDLACGNGRILQELVHFGTCTACDASRAMLHAVQEKFAGADVRIQELDLISQQPNETFDVITIFRFIRHYSYETRRGLWRKLRNALNENGILLFDVPNNRFEIPHRQKNGWGKYNIYDVFWSKKAIEKEMRDNGFRLLALVPVGQGLYPMPQEYRSEPMTWTAAATPLA